MLYQTENPHGGDLYGREGMLDFSSNINPLGTPEAVRRAAIESLAGLERYPDPFCRRLRAAIAVCEGVPEEWILCGSGAAELIYSFCAAARPDPSLELAPTFSEYALALAAADCRTIRYPLEREHDFTLAGDFLPALERSGARAVFLCNPNNPTGRLIPQALLEQTAELCHEKGVCLFVDECFLDLSDGWENGSLKHLLGSCPELMILKAFTKNYGMAGLRLGYCLCADGALLSEMSKAVQPWNVSVPAQAAGVAALEERGFLERARAVIFCERTWMTKAMRELGLWVCPSQANYLLFYAPFPLAEKTPAHGVLLRDCGNYPGLGKGWFRAAVKRREKNERLLAALSAAIREAH
ncbi:MAG: aminotransferase class I/II-fold pyridoxal phosphate-dependent enzyme [Clostridia bacterium]|nr:aminotransferase class I/II-fold pyridoxal phosphate-dependent enzyme [Clostridia bacterium]